MGVKRKLSLTQVKNLFPAYKFSSLVPSSSGIVDTTYISDKYIIKYYERGIKEKISLDSDISLRLQSAGLNVSRLLKSSQAWYLYEKLQGSSPRSIHYFHIQALARFMAKLHSVKIPHRESFIQKYAIKQRLLQIKSTNYRFYKTLEPLKSYKPQNDGFIHGDIFKDNTVFTQEKIGVFDFIDGGNGSYVFDISVALLSFNSSKRSSYITLFLKTYNQNAPKKIDKTELAKNIKIAALFYGMLRLESQISGSRAKELIFW
ncbi:MAG TPA: phosphotransferase [Sulfurimonas sp.]|nr:phosphotransferase [Sulfurimonas sp.]